MTRSCTILTLGMLAGLVAAAPAGAAYNWTEVDPSGAHTSSIYVCATMSADGTRIAIGQLYGELYTSSDGGATWATRQPTSDTWQDMACSADGSRLIAATFHSVLISTNAGETWTQVRPAGDETHTWQTVASSADGMKLVAAAYTGRLFTSVNGGLNWTEQRPLGQTGQTWRRVLCSADGSRVVACAESLTSLLASADGGVTWTALTMPWTNQNWRVQSLSSDGTRIVAADNPGGLYTSTDSGQTWVFRRPEGDVFTESNVVAVGSADGLRLLIGEHPAIGPAYSSADGGQTWIVDQAVPNTGLMVWWPMACSGNGQKALLRMYDSRTISCWGEECFKLFIGELQPGAAAPTGVDPAPTPTTSDTSGIGGTLVTSPAAGCGAAGAAPLLMTAVMLGLMCRRR